MEDFSGKILVVDDEIDLRKLLWERLTKLGYKVCLASDGKDALVKFADEKPDLIILDIMLPKLDGYEVCREIREKSNVPIIILTSLNTISDRVVGLKLGADDYMMKPFSLKELEARIKSVLRRSNFKAPTPPKAVQKIFQIDNLVIDLNTKKISKNRSQIKLTDIEFRLLELLVENAGKKLSRAMLLENIWGYKPERPEDARIVDVHISRIRSKIEEDPRSPDLIITARGAGYMFQKY